MQRTISIIGIIFILLLSSLSYSTIGTDETTSSLIYVDDDNISGPWDGSEEHPYKTIIEGVTASVDGDTVFVYSGSYDDFEILINTSIDLIGEDKESTIIEEGQIILFRGEESSISGFSLNNCLIESEHQNHMEIFDNNILGEIYITGSNTSLIYHNNISYTNKNYQSIGIRVSDDSTVNIEHNVISNESIGIRLWSNNGKILNNTIKDNEEGIFIYGNNNLISDNIILNNKGGEEKGYGIYINGVNNIATRNHLAYNYYGIKIEAENGNEITKNNFIGNVRHVNLKGSLRGYNNHWDKNYWSGSLFRGLLPKLLFGIGFGMVPIPGPGDLIFWIPWFSIEIQFDWHPAKEPYDITI